MIGEVRGSNLVWLNALFLHCLASVFINSQGKYRKVLHGLVWGHTKSPILTPPIPVSGVTSVSAKDHTSYYLTSNSLKPVTVPAWKKATKRTQRLRLLHVNHYSGTEGVQKIPLYFIHCVCICVFLPLKGYDSMVGWSILYFRDKMILSF